MPKNQYIIPRPNKNFDAYIMNSTRVLQQGTPATWQRLGLTATENTQWIDFRDRWEQQYKLYFNKALRTTVITNEKNKLRKDFIAFATPVLLKIAAHPALNTGDRLNFRLLERDRILTKRGRIEDVPMALMQPAGGGILNIRVRRETDNNRASRHPLADGIEMKYLIADVNATPPNSADDCVMNYISKKAIFRFQTKPGNAGKRIYAFFRWINLSNYENSGSWTDRFTTVIA
jgi:hypothetical protein